MVQCPQLKIIRIDMSIYFGSINHIQKEINQIVDLSPISNLSKLVTLQVEDNKITDISALSNLQSHNHELKGEL